MIRWLLAGAVALFGFVVPTIAQQPAAVNGCQYLATPPTLSDKQTIGFLCDVNGNLQSTATITSSGGALMLDTTGQSILSAVQGSVPAGTANIGSVNILPTTTATYGISPVVTGSAGTGQVIKAGAGNLYSLEVQSGASAGYVMVHDAVAVPSAGAVTPKKCYALAANSAIGVTYNPPIVMATGISVSFSTTGCFTQTDSATAFISGEAK